MDKVTIVFKDDWNIVYVGSKKNQEGCTINVLTLLDALGVEHREVPRPKDWILDGKVNLEVENRVLQEAYRLVVDDNGYDQVVLRLYAGGKTLDLQSLAIKQTSMDFWHERLERDREAFKDAFDSVLKRGNAEVRISVAADKRVYVSLNHECVDSARHDELIGTLSWAESLASMLKEAVGLITAGRIEATVKRPPDTHGE